MASVDSGISFDPLYSGNRFREPCNLCNDRHVKCEHYLAFIAEWKIISSLLLPVPAEKTRRMIIPLPSPFNAVLHKRKFSLRRNRKNILTSSSYGEWSWCKEFCLWERIPYLYFSHGVGTQAQISHCFKVSSFIKMECFKILLKNEKWLTNLINYVFWSTVLSA